MADAAIVKDHPLTLKVMRLTKPSFGSAGNFSFKDCPLNERLLTSESLLLPQAIENIYLGETFSCYVCLHNDSDVVIQDINLKVDLQSSTQRISLANKYQDSTVSLNPGESLGEIVHHEVKEMGQHILVCAITYTNQTGEKPYFRKFFKFPVAKPLDVRTKFYNAESDDVFLEAQIQNTSHLPMVLERVVLEPSDLYTVEEMEVSSDHISQKKPKSIAKIPSYLNPNDIRQFLYCLKPHPDLPMKSFKGVTQVGKIDMVWYTTNGERGRLQTSQLQRVVPGSGDIRLMVNDAPSATKLGETFAVQFRLHNCVDRNLDLTLMVDDSLNRGLSWHFASNDDREKLNCGILEPDSDTKITLKMKAEEVGLHTINGIRIKDSLSDRLYEYDEVAQIFVYS
uniref:Trafficking protein particle complex subunit 13 n=1 Tax=Romanomermis culicivorax TaxID=13658 RepID=A0A915IBK4_ROMCU